MAANLANAQAQVGKYIGDGQCYAWVGWWSARVCGYSISYSTGDPMLPLIGDGMNAHSIHLGWDWSIANTGIVNYPVGTVGRKEDLRVGAIWCATAFSGAPFYTGQYGHTGIIESWSDTTVTVLEQNILGSPVIRSTYDLNTFLSTLTGLITFKGSVDPYPYLAKWGVSREQFKRDIENGLGAETGWQKNDKGYWYVHSDGSYPKDKFEKINGTWYYFDGSGYMLADRWKKHSDGNWYYFDQSGEMATGWKKIVEKWYYFDVEGAMKTGWVKYKDTWYYLDSKGGNMVSNEFVRAGQGWYYIKPDGSMADKPEFTVEPDGLITTK
nr:ClyJ [synthetic construct]